MSVLNNVNLSSLEAQKNYQPNTYFTKTNAKIFLMLFVNFIKPVQYQSVTLVNSAISTSDHYGVIFRKRAGNSIFTQRIPPASGQRDACKDDYKRRSLLYWFL